MAEDLIPDGPEPSVEIVPPSTSQELVPLEQDGGLPGPLRLAGYQERTYRARFGLAYAVLAALVMLAGAGAVAVLTRSTEAGPPPWSTWVPSAEGFPRAQEIAEHVSGTYRLPDGAQLVAAQAAPPAYQSQPLVAIAISKVSSNGLPAADFDVYAADKTLSFQLCGGGKACAIRTGTPSQTRDRLLRRESLELALYTFEYMPDIDSVISFLPPRPGQPPQWAMFFRRQDFAPQLAAPLAGTLAPKVPLADKMTTREATTVEALTAPRRFRFSFEQLQNGSHALVLIPTILTG